MKVTESLQHLYERYKAERASAALNLLLFEQLINLFPAILIAQADGHIDTTEIIHLNKLAQLIHNRIPEIAEQDLKNEIRYLTWNTEVWRHPILNFLKHYIAEKNNSDDIIQLMISTASSSTGSLIGNLMMGTTPIDPNEAKADFISDDERNEILKITEELGLSSSPEKMAKLNFILNNK